MKRGKSTNKSRSGSGKGTGKEGQRSGGKGDGEENSESQEDEEEDEDQEEDEREEGEEEESEEDDDSENSDDKGKKEKKGKLDLAALPEEAQRYIKGLRKEAAKHRTKAARLKSERDDLATKVKKAVGDDEESNEADDKKASKDSNAEAAAQELAFDNATLHLALDHEITDKDAIEWFQYLVRKAAGRLEEDEELDEDELEEIAERVKKKFGAPKERGKANSSVDTRGKGGNGKTKDNVDVAQFAKMNVFEKQRLFKKNPELYDSLFAEAKQKRLLGI